MASSDLCAALRAARLHRALTQAQVARWSGMQQGELSRLEAGRHDVRLLTLQRLAAALDLELMLVPKELTVEVNKLIARARGEPPSSAVVPSLLELYGVSDDDDEDDEDA